RVCSTSARARTRPDMAWLMKLVSSLEADIKVRKALRMISHQLTTLNAGRLTLDKSVSGPSNCQYARVSVRATAEVKHVLALAQRPISYHELASNLHRSHESATPEKIDALLTQLYEQGFLITDLRPPLTCDYPARYVREYLCSIPAALPALCK